MSEYYLTNGQVYIDHTFEEMTVGIHNGKIELLPADEKLPETANIIDVLNHREDVK